MRMHRNLLGRYLFFEVLRTWLLVAGVLLFLTLGLGFARFIAEAAAGNLPVHTVLQLAFYSAIENGGIVLPISVLLAVLLTIGRLCRDNEMAALQAGGAGLLVIYRPFIVLALLVALFAGWLSLVAAPHASKTIDRLTAQSVATALQTLVPGRFLTLLDGKAVFYAQSRDGDSGVLRDVFIRVLHRNDAGRLVQTVITAERALQRTEKDTGAQILVLEQGWRYQGQVGQADWRLVQFEEHGVRVALDQAAAVSNDVADASTASLLQRDDPAAAAEFQARMSVPLAIVILALLGLPLGQLPPRAGRYGRIFVGILLYVVYFNVLHLTIIWVQTRLLPAFIGTWSVHAAMLLLASMLILREQGGFMRKKGKVGA